MSWSNDATAIARGRALAARIAKLGGGGGGARALRNGLFLLFLGSILAYAASFAWYMLDRFDLVNLLRDVNGDDSFYYFQIARNLAEGKFSTFDGGITRTNGYHPLWVLLIAPFYWVFDAQTALFAIKVFEILLIAGAVALIAVAARLARLPWILLFAALPMLYQNPSLFAGFEAAAALFLLGLLVLATCLFARNPERWKWTVAAVAFLLPWVRLEYIAISLTSMGALCLLEWSWKTKPSGERSEGFTRSLPTLTAFVPFLGATAGILAYFAWNGLLFGGITPVSGAFKRLWSQQKWDAEGGYSLSRNFHEVLQIPAFGAELAWALGICVCLPLIWWAARGSRGRTDRLLAGFLVPVFGLAAGHLAKFAQTVLTVDPHWGAAVWYFVPAYLMTALLVPVGCYVLLRLVPIFVGPPLGPWLSRGIIAAGVVALWTQVDVHRPFRFFEQASERLTFGWVIQNYMGAQVMNSVLPADSVVGSHDAGVIGYFSSVPVVNLDGLVNSYDYLRAVRDGDAASNVRRYGITHFGITHFANTQRSDRGVEGRLFEGPGFRHRDGERRFRIWSAEPLRGADDAARFRREISSRSSHRTDGVALFADGRMLQAFTRDCEPEALLVVSMAPGRNPVTATPWERWTDARRNEPGFCVAAAVLPRTVSSPVRIEMMPASDYLSWRIADRRPIMRSDWDVYLIEGSQSLLYVKEPCGKQDTAPRFFLHLDPVDTDDLPDHRERYGFDNLDFVFSDHSLLEGSSCVAWRELPGYDIVAIRTGQYIPGEGRSWEGGFDVVGPTDER